jgi:hypothetical protein
MLINKDIYFVHIPRTGGKYINILFKINNHQVRLNDFKQWKNKEIPHLTFPDYEIFLNFLECKKFSIIRNPIDRFVSAINSDIKLNENTINKMLSNQETFNMYLNNLIFNDDSNWYTPQVNFLNYNTQIYRYEDGLNINFVKWVNDNLNLKLTILPNPVIDTKKIYLTTKQKQFVENYYYKDLKLLNY